MRLCRLLVGDDEDAAELFEAARRAGSSRVVVKRPRGAPDLNDQEPSYRLEGILNGEIDEFIDALTEADQAKKLEQLAEA